MKKIAIFFLLSAAAGAVLAQEAVTTPQVASEETVTLQDLGVLNPGILPTSPFYFFKELGRGIQGFITFNPVAKAELQLRFANEKAAEAVKVTENQPQNAEAIEKALENYQETQSALRARLEGLKETSQNPNVDELLSRLTEKTVKHEKLFDEIAFKFGDKEQVARAISELKAGNEEVVGQASRKDDPAKFASRLEKVLLEEKGGELKHARSVEIIDRLFSKTAEATKESLEKLREDFSKKLETDIQELITKEGETAFKDKVTGTPGSLSQRSVIIEEIQKRANERLSRTLDEAMSQLEGIFQKERDIAQKAKEQIRRAEEIILEADKKMTDSKAAEVASSLLAEAKNHLANAKKSFEQEQYGEAFGQARSAEVLARNALKFFEQAKPETENFEQRLKELEEKIGAYRNLLKERGYTEDHNKDAYDILNNAVLHLGYAKESFAKGNLENTKMHISHVKDFLAKLARILEGKFPEVSTKAVPSTLAPIAVNCEEITKRILQLKELLASRGITEADFKIKYDSHLRNLIVCQEGKNAIAPLPAPQIKPLPPTLVSPVPVSPDQTACTLEYSPVCGSNGKTYSNSCFAKAAGITIIYRGECETKIETETETKTETGATTDVQTQTQILQATPVLAVKEVKLEADDSGFYPDSTIKVAKGSRVKLTFFVRSTNVYHGGLDVRSNVFKTGTIKPGSSGTVEFTANESFEFTSWWPLTDVQKSRGMVAVE